MFGLDVHDLVMMTIKTALNETKKCSLFDDRIY